MIYKGESAFPVPEVLRKDGCTIAEAQSGMTLRDYFAAKAMQPILQTTQLMMEITHDDVAQDAYLYADAMMKARANK